MDNNLKLDLDPKKIVQQLNDVSEAVRNLSKIFEDSLGKEASASVDKLEKAAEKGSNSIAAQFRNLGQRVKNDLKTAFDVGAIAGGLKIASQLGEGIKEVFNLERAFDRLNTRLQMTGKAYDNFKKSMGEKISATGQKLEDVMPGVETASAKGGVQSPEQLSMIGEQLAKVRAATGESTDTLMNSVVEILKQQGKAVNASTVKDTLDTLQGTRVNGAFKSAGEAGSAIQTMTSGISPEQMKKMGLGTRELGGLAAMSSQAGQGGQDVMQHILQMATQAGGKQLLNSIFGTNLFKGDKLDVGAFQKVNKQRFGQYSEQVLSSATGADQAGLSRWLDAMKQGQADFKKVTSGSNEVGSQFAISSNNLATGFDKFKEKTKNAGRQLGEDLSGAANELLKGNVKGALGKGQDALKGAWENKGVIGGALATTVAGGALLGGGIGGLAKKIPGLGGLAGGLAGGELAKAAGATPVYVVNASEIGGGGGVSGALGKFGSAAKAGLGGLALGGGAALGVAAANTETGQKIGNAVLDPIFKAFDLGGEGKAQKGLEDQQAKSKAKSENAGLKEAVAAGMVEGHNRINKSKPVQYINPSKPVSGGAHQ